MAFWNKKEKKMTTTLYVDTAKQAVRSAPVEDKDGMLLPAAPTTRTIGVVSLTPPVGTRVVRTVQVSAPLTYESLCSTLGGLQHNVKTAGQRGEVVAIEFIDA